MATLLKPRIAPHQLADAIANSQTYAAYTASIPANGAALENNFKAVRFTHTEAQAIDAIQGQLKVLAIVEEWCPDVIVNLPTVARIAEHNPAIQLHILYRPDHQAIADAYPGPHTGRSHIPTFVLFDEQDRELGILIERPAAITDIVKPYAERIQAELAERFPGIARQELPKDYLTDLIGRSLALRAEHRDLERNGIVEWLVQSARLGA